MSKQLVEMFTVVVFNKTTKEDQPHLKDKQTLIFPVTLRLIEYQEWASNMHVKWKKDPADSMDKQTLFRPVFH